MDKTVTRTVAMIIALLTVFLSSCGQPSSNKLTDQLHSFTPIETADSALDSSGYKFQSNVGIRNEKGELDSLKDLLINKDFFYTYIEKYGLHDLLNHYNGYLSCAMIRSDDGSFDDGYLYIDEINDRDGQIRKELTTLPEYKELETFVIKDDDIKKMHGSSGYYSGNKDEINEGETVTGEFNNAQKDNEVYKSSRTNRNEKKYYGDWEVDYTVNYDYDPGKYGWNNGVFEDEQASWEEASNVRVYYKGELFANMVNASPDDYSIECRLIDGDVFVWNDCSNNPGQWIIWPKNFSASDIESLKGNSFSGDNIASYANARPGDLIELGHFEQDSNLDNEKEPINWIVLENKDGQLLVISEKILVSMQYYKTDTKKICWDSCPIRTWLNSEFLEEAFSKDESNIIQKTSVKATKNPEYDTDQGEDTEDKVFILSSDEAKKYLNLVAEADTTRACYKTDFENKRTTIAYWFRTKSSDGNAALCWSSTVHEGDIEGRIDNWGEYLYDYEGVRPVMWIKPAEYKHTESEKKENEKGSIDSEDDGKEGSSLKNAKTGSSYMFGMYEQDNNTGNGKEPIEWIVLDKKGNQVLLISKSVLDAKQLENDHSKTDATWKDSKLNKWLNNEFVKDAFTDQEVKRIASNVDSSYDSVFLLSWEEAEPYIEDGGILAYAEATEYSKSIDHDAKEWWVRSLFYADTVKELKGNVVDGSSIDMENAWNFYGVRPAIWVNVEG